MKRESSIHISFVATTGIRRLLALAAIAFLSTVFAPPVLAQVCGAPPCGAGSSGKQITVTTLQPLEFALVGATPSAGTVTIDSATGSKVAVGGAIDLGGVHSRAYFEIRGTKNTNFSILLPASVTIVGPGGASTTVTGLESTPAFSGTFNQQGKAWVYVGGILQVGASQAAALYTALFDITIDYLP